MLMCVHDHGPREPEQLQVLHVTGFFAISILEGVHYLLLAVVRSLGAVAKDACCRGEAAISALMEFTGSNALHADVLLVDLVRVVGHGRVTAYRMEASERAVHMSINGSKSLRIICRNRGLSPVDRGDHVGPFGRCVDFE